MLARLLVVLSSFEVCSVQIVMVLLGTRSGPRKFGKRKDFGAQKEVTLSVFLIKYFQNYQRNGS